MKSLLNYCIANTLSWGHYIFIVGHCNRSDICVYIISKISIPITGHVRIKRRIKAWLWICMAQLYIATFKVTQSRVETLPFQGMDFSPHLWWPSKIRSCYYCSFYSANDKIEIISQFHNVMRNAFLKFQVKKENQLQAAGGTQEHLNYF